MKTYFKFLLIYFILFSLFSNKALGQPIFCPSCDFLQCESTKTCQIINGCGNCVDISTATSSSSGNSFNINNNFNGIWKSTPIKVNSASSSSGSCIKCTKATNCSNKETLIPKSCNACASCIKKDFLQKMNLTLCVNNNILEGILNQGTLLNNAVLSVESTPSKSSLEVSTNDSSNNKRQLTFNLINPRKMTIMLSNGLTTQATKISTNGCLFPVCPNFNCPTTINVNNNCKIINMLTEAGCGDCPTVSCN